MSESQKSVSEWAEATFGPCGSNFSVACRANQEMAVSEVRDGSYTGR